MKAARQTGAFATKYSNVYDLKSGDIFLFPLPNRDTMVTLNLAEELKKGGHFYEMPEISDELAQAPMPLSRMSHFAMLESLIGDWWLDLPRDADKLPKYAEYNFALTETKETMRVDSWFVKGTKRVPIDSGIFIWDPAQGKMLFFDSSTNSHGTFTRGAISQRGDDLFGEYKISNYDGSVSGRHILFKKSGANILIMESSALQNGTWTKPIEIRFVRRGVSNTP